MGDSDDNFLEGSLMVIPSHVLLVIVQKDGVRVVSTFLPYTYVPKLQLMSSIVQLLEAVVSSGIIVKQ